MRQVLSLWIPGRPKTKGSLNFVPGKRCRCCSRCTAHLDGGYVEENVAGSKVWRELMRYRIAGAMAAAGADWPLVGAATVAASFHLPVGNAAAPRVGDLDKLSRNLLDAGEDAGLWKDDSQVTRLLADKIAETNSERDGPGVDLRILVP